MREGRETGFRYSRTDTGDTQVGRRTCGGGDGGRKKTVEGEAGHWTEGEEGWAGPISKLGNNKRRSIGSEWSMSKVGTPPTHNLDNPHGLVASINNNNVTNHH